MTSVAGLRPLRPALPVLLLLAAVGLPGGPSTAAPAENAVRACFEGPGASAASEAAARTQASDDTARNMADIAGGGACQKIAADTVSACLGQIDALPDDAGMRDYYGCIGVVANPCIDSTWSASEFRSVVCVDVEEKVWLDMVQEHLANLEGSLDPEGRTRLETMEKAFFEYRNEKCGLFRTLRAGNEADLAYSACATETTARLAIDLRDMWRTLLRTKQQTKASTE